MIVSESDSENVGKAVRRKRQAWGMFLCVPSSERKAAQDFLRDVRALLKDKYPDVDRRFMMEVFDPSGVMDDADVDIENLKSELHEAYLHGQRRSAEPGES